MRLENTYTAILPLSIDENIYYIQIIHLNIHLYEKRELSFLLFVKKNIYNKITKNLGYLLQLDYYTVNVP